MIRKYPADVRWPPEGVRDLKPEKITNGDRLDKMRDALRKAGLVE